MKKYFEFLTIMICKVSLTFVHNNHYVCAEQNHLDYVKVLLVQKKM